MMFQQMSSAWIYLVHHPGTIIRSIFLDCNAWVMLSSMSHSKESRANSLKLKENDPKTESIQTLVSPVSIHAFASCDNCSLFEFLASCLASLNTTISFSLVPLVLAAKHTDTLAFFWLVKARVIDLLPVASIVLSDIMSHKTGVSSIAMISEGP